MCENMILILLKDKNKNKKNIKNNINNVFIYVFLIS